jgi:hypothetical protein
MSYPADISDDVSTGASYDMNIHLENSRMTKAERKAAHEIVRRHVAALQVQLHMMLGDRVGVALQRQTTTSGVLHMDLKVQTDE